MFDTQEIRAGVVPPDTSGSLAMPPVGSGQPVHILDRLNAVFKHRRIAGTAFVLVVTSMMVQTYSTIPIYQTSARIEIQDERSTSVDDDRRQRSDLVAGVGAVLPDAVPDSSQPRARAPGRAPAESEGEPELQRPRAAAARSDRAGPAGPRVAVGVGTRPVHEEDPRRRRRRRRDESAQEAGLISAFLGGVIGHAVRDDAAGRCRLPAHRPGFRRGGGQHARRGVHAAEPRSAAVEQFEGARVRQRAARSRDAEGQAGRTVAAAVSRSEQRAVARRPPEHRRRAADVAEPGGHREARRNASRRKRSTTRCAARIRRATPRTRFRSSATTRRW